MKNTEIGRLAEEAAARYLEQQGYVLIERNYRTKTGEVDIVAEDSGTLTFVEVRSRQGAAFGLPQETVNWAKQQKLRLVAREYLRKIRAWNRFCRFDVVAVLFDVNYRIKAIELIKDAF